MLARVSDQVLLIISVLLGLRQTCYLLGQVGFFGSKEDQEPGSLQFFSVLQEEEEQQEQREA